MRTLPSTFVASAGGMMNDDEVAIQNSGGSRVAVAACNEFGLAEGFMSLFKCKCFNPDTLQLRVVS